ncbi:MFS general substrate transporter [Dichomitus squalens]|nr:MFS general substrate transporter [Dichomitus squalens]
MSSVSAPLLPGEAASEATPNHAATAYATAEETEHAETPSRKEWIKPSPAWILTLVAVAAVSTSGTVAPRAAAAAFIAVVSGLTGLLSTLTAAWWGALSDCYGRIGVLGFNVAGLMLSDFVFLTTAHFWERLPGTYWWFALGPVIEGLVGGISVASIIMHAYISDCCDPTQRSRAFSQLMGLLFIGMSVGPILTGYVIDKTNQILPVFYVTTIIDTAVSLAVWLIMPESLSSTDMQEHRARRKQRLQSLGPGIAGWLRRVVTTVDIVSPLAVLLPRRVDDRNGKRSVDWIMTVLGLAYGFGTFIQGSVVFQIQYAWMMFDWTAGVVSYWLAAIHIAKAVYLTLLFPALVKLLAWLWKQRQAPSTESEPLLSDQGEYAPTQSRKKVAPAASLDLLLARAAVVTDLVFYALVFSTSSGALFALFTMCVSLGTSFGPTMQSLALDLYARRGHHDTGSLLGALTVVSALSSHILAPALFGFTLARTVETLPGAFFLVGCAALLTMSRSSSRDVAVPLLRAALDPDRLSRSRSRPGSQPRHARHSTANSISSIPVGPEDLINPGGGGPISEEESELLQDLVHRHQHQHAVEETLVEEESGAGSGEEEEEEFDDEWRQKRPWYRRPSPVWFLSYVPFAAIAMTIAAAAKIELFIYLVCLTHRPQVNPDQGSDIVSFIARNVSATFLDEPNQRVCKSDPTVQAAVAQLNTVMTTTMGVLACMTTAWWGSLSDRYGRTRVLGCAVIGVLIQDASFLAAFWFYDHIPGGYWSLLIGPLVEGCLGGQALISATIHAYIADCTPPARRSAVFSLNLGLLFTGVGVGPLLGGLLIRFTGKFIIVFYISAIIHLIYALLVWFIVPESLSKAELQEARSRYKVANEEYFAAHAHGGILVFFKRMFAFLTPLAIFLPTRLVGGNPAKGQRRDWSLLFVVLAYAFVISLMGLYLYIIQYLEGSYGWDTEQVGYWFSSIGAARALFLTLLLPAIIKLLKPKAPPIQLSREADEPLTSPTDASFPAEQSGSASKREHEHDPKFDLNVAKVSVIVEAVVYLLMLLSPDGLTFAITTAFGALGMGFSPAIHSVALTLYNRRGGKDSGRLFGAMSVVQALSSQVFGPAVYGFTFMKTVGTYPRTIFFMGVCSLVVSTLLLQLVRLPKNRSESGGEGADVEEQLSAEPFAPGIEREDTLVGPSEPLIIVEGEDRGRKVVKTVP